MHRRDLHKYSKIGMVAILIILILDAINICSILSIPFNNFNLDMWNILVVIILYVLTYEIIHKRDSRGICKNSIGEYIPGMLFI